MVDRARARQIGARLREIEDELAALRVELGDEIDAQSPEQRRRAFRVVDGDSAAAGGRVSASGGAA